MSNSSLIRWGGSSLIVAGIAKEPSSGCWSFQLGRFAGTDAALNSLWVPSQLFFHTLAALLALFGLVLGAICPAWRPGRAAGINRFCLSSLWNRFISG